MARVHHHVGGSRRVTGHAIHALASIEWKWCCGDSYFAAKWHCKQTLLPVARNWPLWVRGSRRNSPPRLHLALQERTMIEHFILHLAVGVVEVRVNSDKRWVSSSDWPET